MEVEVYADLLFLINAGMDGLCFLLTARLLHRRVRPWRMILGAVLGGIYAVVSLLLDVGRLTALGVDLLVCLLMCAAVFSGSAKGRGRILVPTGVYFLLSMVLGGIMTALYHLFNRMGLESRLPAGEEGAGVWLFAVLALAGYGITLLSGRLLGAKASAPCASMVIELDGRSLTLGGILDTGNLLRDPLSGRPVICVRRESLAPLLSPTLAAVLCEGADTALLSDSPDARRLRLIPADTATGGGLLMGFIPDRVVLQYEQRGHSAERDVAVTVAAVEGLSDTEALIPAELTR